MLTLNFLKLKIKTQSQKTPTGTQAQQGGTSPPLRRPPLPVKGRGKEVLNRGPYSFKNSYFSRKFEKNMPPQQFFLTYTFKANSNSTIKLFNISQDSFYFCPLSLKKCLQIWIFKISLTHSNSKFAPFFFNNL